jgi:hypothetical protein
MKGKVFVFVGLALIGLGIGNSVAQAPNVEDFETGNLTKFPWQTGGDAPWVITPVSHGGAYAVQAGKIGDNQRSWLQVTLNVIKDDKISFWFQVSSEANADFLLFSIDGKFQGRWSGEIGWQEARFPVTAGNHTFRWEYIKDGSGSFGKDTAYLDDIAFPSFSISPPPPTLQPWDKTFGGSGNDWGFSVQQTSDGGFIILGETRSFGAGESDVWLIKTDANGNKLWDQTFGGSRDDGGVSVQQTSDGGYILVGSTHSFGSGYYDVWLIKADANGNKLWDRTFGGGKDDYGLSVQQTSDGGYILVGRTVSFGAGDGDVWLIKTDGNGNKLWDRTLGGSRDDWGRSVQQTNDGGYILVGATYSFGSGNYDVWLIKTNANGNKLWDRTFGGSGDDYGYSVQQTNDSGYILLGTSKFGGDYGFRLIKTDANGNELWDKAFGGSKDDWGRSVQQTSDGGYILLGWTYSFGAGNADVWLIKTDANGNKQWEKTFGGSSGDFGYSVQQTSDGGYILVGGTYSFGTEGSADVWLIKYRP